MGVESYKVTLGSKERSILGDEVLDILTRGELIESARYKESMDSIVRVQLQHTAAMNARIDELIAALSDPNDFIVPKSWSTKGGRKAMGLNEEGAISKETLRSTLNRFVPDRVAAAEGRSGIEEVSYTFNQLKKGWVEKLFSDLREDKQLGHANISSYTATIVTALSAKIPSGMPCAGELIWQHGTKGRKALAWIYIYSKKLDSLEGADALMLQSIDKGGRGADASLIKLTNELNELTKGGYDITMELERDVAILENKPGTKATVKIEDERENRAKGAHIARVAKALGKIDLKNLKESYVELAKGAVANFADMEGSKTLRRILTEQIIDIAIGKSKNPKYKSKGKVADKKKRVKTDNTRVNKLKGAARKVNSKASQVLNAAKQMPLHSSTGKSRGKTESGDSLAPLIAILNSKLPETVARNMGPPGLENQTGRFASSVRVTDVSRTPQGHPSVGYGYQKNPYQVFETGQGRAPWATPDRDPRKLIDKSIREIAAQFAIGRFYTRRI